jgi:hypothetical protein
MTDKPDMTCIPIGPPGPTAEQLQAYADSQRKRLSDNNLLRILCEMVCAKCKEELRRLFPEAFRD